MKVDSCKITALVSAFLFILPIATFYCCCTQTTSLLAGSHSDRHETGHNEGNCHHGESGPVHDNGQCNHSEIVCSLVNQSTQLLSLFSSSQKGKINFLQNDATTNVSSFRNKSTTIHGVGPPGLRVLSAPLHLQVSVLRI